ncbi:MAG: ATP-dependent Clp protease adaptor ClpS [Bacteroidales bacterium]|nr:ATP-dependent Clp protease adaptor ClpS [Bacteroidales bacterium]MBQ9312768.1 ATP-dependent Clp protease adaptor ClpS [Bacteroidales bacterium]
MNNQKTESEGLGCCMEVSEEGNELIVYNDDVHTFDFVIECLETICFLSKEQAVTCTNIIHYKGLCTVKHGSYDELLPMCIALEKKGLNVELK